MNASNPQSPLQSPVRPPVSGDDARYKMPASLEGLVEDLKEQFGEGVLGSVVYRGELTVCLDRICYLGAMHRLRDDKRWKFDFLTDVTAIDWLLRGAEPRFENVVHLYSIDQKHRVCVKTPLDESDLRIPSLVSLWPTADFHERETYDMYGIVYDGHPNLKRILMPDEWEGWPLRKDFPLGGVKSFYFKESTVPRFGEPKDLVPRIREHNSDI